MHTVGWAVREQQEGGCRQAEERCLRSCTCQNLDLELPASRTLRKYISAVLRTFCCLRHPHLQYFCCNSLHKLTEFLFNKSWLFPCCSWGQRKKAFILAWVCSPDHLILCVFDFMTLVLSRNDCHSSFWVLNYLDIKLGWKAREGHQGGCN